MAADPSLGTSVKVSHFARWMKRTVDQYSDSMAHRDGRRLDNGERRGGRNRASATGLEIHRGRRSVEIVGLWQ